MEEEQTKIVQQKTVTTEDKEKAISESELGTNASSSQSSGFSQFVAEYCQVIRNIRDHFWSEAEKKTKRLILKPSGQIRRLENKIKEERDEAVKRHCSELRDSYLKAKNLQIYDFETLKSYRWAESASVRLQKNKGIDVQDTGEMSELHESLQNKGDSGEISKACTLTKVTPEKTRPSLISRESGDNAGDVVAGEPEKASPSVWTGWNQHYVDDLIDKGTPGRRGPRPKAKKVVEQEGIQDGCHVRRIKKRWARKQKAEITPGNFTDHQ